MMEPFTEIRRHGGSSKAGFESYSATDSMCKIDNIERISLDKGWRLIGSDTNLTGGNMMPRTGR
jgi:hypothetical protein